MVLRLNWWYLELHEKEESHELKQLKLLSSHLDLAVLKLNWWYLELHERKQTSGVPVSLASSLRPALSKESVLAEPYCGGNANKQLHEVLVGTDNQQLHEVLVGTDNQQLHEVLVGTDNQEMHVITTAYISLKTVRMQKVMSRGV